MITVNGQPRPLPQPPTVAALLAELGLAPGMVVVEHNGQALTRTQAAAAPLADDDRLEVIRAVAGG